MSSIFDRIVLESQLARKPEEPLTEAASPLRPGDGQGMELAPRTSSDVKKVTQELLKYGYLEAAEKPELFRSAVLREQEIMTALEPLDLELRLDTHRGVAFLVVAQAAYEERDDEAAWSHPLVRRQRLTLEQSLLVAILRQAFVLHEQESGVGQGTKRIAVDDLLPQFMTYFGDSGSDAKNEMRLLNLLDQLKPHGVVSQVDERQELAIRPLIVHLANPESLTALLKVLKTQATTLKATEQQS